MGENAKELVAELRENAKILLDDHDRSYEGFANSFLKAADYIERTVSPADLVLETTVEERAKLTAIATAAAAAWADITLKTIDRLDQTIIRVDGELLNRFIRDHDTLTAALAAARAMPPPDGPEYETTAEERAHWAGVLATGPNWLTGEQSARLLRDLAKAIEASDRAFAASKTKVGRFHPAWELPYPKDPRRPCHNHH